MHEDDGANIACLQAMAREVTGQRDDVEFPNHLSALLQGTAVTNLGRFSPVRMNQTVRSHGFLPSGVVNSPSIIYRDP